MAELLSLPIQSQQFDPSQFEDYSYLKADFPTDSFSFLSNLHNDELMSILTLIPNNSQSPSPTSATNALMHKQSQMTGILSLEVQSWLTCENIQKFISLYFDNFQLHTPFLHKPTFNPLTTPDSLLFCIVLIGALYSDLESDITKSLVQLRKAFDYIDEKEKSTSHPLHVLQAYICVFNALTWSSTPADRLFARQNFPKLVSLTRHSGLLSLKHTEEYPSSATGWHQWIHTETRLRTIYSIFLLDTSFLIFFNDPPRIVPMELDMPLPAHHNSWDAPTVKEWKQWYSKRPMFLDVVKYVVNVESVDEDGIMLLMYDFFVIIHALYVNMWFQKQLLSIFNTVQINQQKQALSNWKTLWNRSIASTPSKDWEKFGFCRNAMEYYWLARFFLISRNKQVSLRFEKPDALSLAIDERTNEQKTNSIGDGSDENSDNNVTDKELMNVISIMDVVRNHKDIKEVDEIQTILESNSYTSPIASSNVRKYSQSSQSRSSSESDSEYDSSPSTGSSDHVIGATGDNNIFKFLLWNSK